jgi:hypothetical protein
MRQTERGGHSMSVDEVPDVDFASHIVESTTVDIGLPARLL